MSSLAEETGGAVSGAGGGASWPVSIDLGVIAHHIHILMGLAILAEVKFLVAWHPNIIQHLSALRPRSSLPNFLTIRHKPLLWKSKEVD